MKNSQNGDRKETSELSNYFVSEMLPGADATSDEALLEFARRYGVSSYHVIGTARMGPASDPMAVVDDQLQVHGLQGLRIADSSVMPSMPSANTCAATMMIAEKASDMILGKRPPIAERAFERVGVEARTLSKPIDVALQREQINTGKLPNERLY